MGIVRAHVILPEKLAAEIDKVAGPRGRSAFLIDAAETQLRRIKLEAFLDESRAVWKRDNHPELDERGAAHRQRQHRSTRQLLVEAWAEENNS